MNSFYLDSSHFELLTVSGDDAERFLQGQLSCDVSKVTESSFLHGTACNNKGRVIVPFIILKSGADYLLVFGPTLGSLFLAALKKFLPFYKCSMQLNNPAFSCLGLVGTETAKLLQALNLGIPAIGNAHITDECLLATLDAETPQILALVTNRSLLSRLENDPEMISKDDGSIWQSTGMINGHFPFSAEDSEKFTPQELLFDRNEYVSFTKGCYTGQEIVARMHYRGKVKKQLHLLKITVNDSSDLQALKLLGIDGTELAPCIKVVRTGSLTAYALAVLPIESDIKTLSVATNLGVLDEIRPF